ncbi:Cysteine-rich venom protein LEI1, partial [Armadillidium nasatum]
MCELSYQQSNQYYCWISINHSSDKSTKYILNCILTNGEEQDMQELEILDWHNSIREKVATGMETGAKDGKTLPKASNMHKLVSCFNIWNEKLARNAQDWANNSISGNDCETCRETLNDAFSNVGQNIAENVAEDAPTSSNFVTLMNDLYTNQVKHFPESAINNYAAPTDEDYSHYSQVIWGRTKEVGCGAVVREIGGINITLFVCDYRESGNRIGSPVYKTGNPCAECPLDTCSGSLCEHTTGIHKFEAITQPCRSVKMLWLVVIAVVSNIQHGLADCNYCLTPDYPHTMCKHLQEPACGEQYIFNEDEKKIILKLYNDIRQRVFDGKEMNTKGPLPRPCNMCNL